MRSGSLPKHKLKTLSFAEALVRPTCTPEEQNARGRVKTGKRHEKEPEEGKDGKKKGVFLLRQSFDNIGQELISHVAATLREIVKQDVEAPAKAAGTMPLSLTQKMSKVNRCETKTLRTELVEGLGNTYYFDMARK